MSGWCLQLQNTRVSLREKPHCPEAKPTSCSSNDRNGNSIQVASTWSRPILDFCLVLPISLADYMAPDTRVYSKIMPKFLFTTYLSWKLTYNMCQQLLNWCWVLESGAQASAYSATLGSLVLHEVLTPILPTTDSILKTRKPGLVELSEIAH